MEDSLRKVQAGIDERFEKHGWTVMAVMPGEDGSPSFTYSIGFEKTFSMPEVIFVGFEPKLAQSLIAGMAQSLVSREIQVPTEEKRMAGVVRDFDVLARPVSEDIMKRTAFWAVSFNEPKPTRLTQIFLPDREGRFPSDDGCDPKFASLQNISLVAEEG